MSRVLCSEGSSYLSRKLWTKSPQTRFSGRGRERILYKLELRRRRILQQSVVMKNASTLPDRSNFVSRFLDLKAVLLSSQVKGLLSTFHDVLDRVAHIRHVDCTFAEYLAT